MINALAKMDLWQGWGGGQFSLRENKGTKKPECNRVKHSNHFELDIKSKTRTLW